VAKKIPRERYSKLLRKRTTPESKARFRERFDPKMGKKPSGGKKKFPDGGFDLTAPLTARKYRRELASAQKMKFGPEEQQIGQEFAAHRAREAGLPGLFNAYQQRLENVASQNQQAFDQSITQAQNLAASTQQRETEAQSKLQAEAQADAQKRGVSVSTRPYAEGTAGAAVRSTNTQGFANMMGAQKQAAQQRFGAYGLENQGELVNQLLAERRRGEMINARQRDFLGRRGDFATQYGKDAREGERKFALEGQAFGLDVEKLREQTRSNRAEERAATRRDKTTRRGQTLSHQDRQAALDVTKRGQNITSEGQRKSFIKEIGVSPGRWDSWSRGQQARYLKRNDLIGGKKDKKGKTRQQTQQEQGDKFYYDEVSKYGTPPRKAREKAKKRFPKWRR